MATATQCRTNLRATLLEDSAASLRAKANRCRYTRQHACWIPGEWSQRPTESAITLPALDDYCGETEVVALGCELATANDGSTTSQPLRVLLLNSHGNPVLDTHVHASSTNDENAVEGYKVAPEVEKVKRRVKQAIVGKIVVGHETALPFKALGICPSSPYVRDATTAAMFAHTRDTSLATLTQEHLGMTLPEDSLIDSLRAALYIYIKYQELWEEHAHSFFFAA